ncbi:MAG: hypothetical protein U5L96_17055 [Owenweeksia sp.]|nr:hypothetical protein [Owenweeksia sp.]
MSFSPDRYVQLMYRQNLKTLLFRREKFAPRIELIARALFGDLNSPELQAWRGF